MISYILYFIENFEWRLENVIFLISTILLTVCLLAVVLFNYSLTDVMTTFMIISSTSVLMVAIITLASSHLVPWEIWSITMLDFMTVNVIAIFFITTGYLVFEIVEERKTVHSLPEVIEVDDDTNIIEPLPFPHNELNEIKKVYNIHIKEIPRTKQSESGES